MTIKEMYRLWKNGIIHRDFPELWQLFFKTNPTDEQIEALDFIAWRNRDKNFIHFFFGILSGLLLAVGIMALSVFAYW